MQAKMMTIETVDAAGKGLAKIAQLSAVDSDGDTYEAGAFAWPEGGGQWVSILPAHDRRAMPLGKAWVYEKDGWALADLTMNLDTEAGREWHQALKFDLATGKPVVEWSYGFNVLDADHQQTSQTWRRKLKRLRVDEVSPVLRGAGVGTGTMSMKSAELKQAHFAPLIASLGELAGALPADPAAISATGFKQLEEIGAAIGAVIASVKSDSTCGGCNQAFDPKDLQEGRCAGCTAAGKAADNALGAYLKHQSRHHLPAA